ncbi:MAG TPA: GGDEF domain-containing protein [Bacillota bacterium]|nr:GGDEF domain-containing protein [Bacillota bacterium]
MEYLIQFQLNIMTVIILLVIYAMMRIRTEVESFANQILQSTIWVTIIALIVDPLSWVFDGKLFFGSFFLEYSTNFMIVIAPSVLGGLMLSYVDYYIFKDRRRIFKRLYYFQPAALTLTLLIVNMFYPIFFSVNPQTHGYSNGDFYWISYVIIGAMYIYMFFFIIKYRKQTFAYVSRLFIFFFLLPIIGMIIQIFEPRLEFSWGMVTLAIFVVYVFLETTTGERDHLTKLYSRQSYEKYVNQLIETEKDFYIVLIDLDNFKGINDQHGHLKGDQVLVGFSRILEKVFHPNTMVSRLAGDEFMIVVENHMLIDDASHMIYNYIQKSDDPDLKQVKFSYGAKDYQKDMTIDQLYLSVDRKMYEHKHNEE